MFLGGGLESREFIENVLYRLYQFGTRLDQRVRSNVLRGVDRTWDRKDFTILFKSKVGRNQRSTLLRSFYHEDTQRETRNDAIALWECIDRWLHMKMKLGNDGSSVVLRDAPRDWNMNGWINLVNAGSQDCNRLTPCIKTSDMGCLVNSIGEAADYHETCCCQLPSKVGSCSDTFRRRFAAAHDGNAIPEQNCCVTQNLKEDRWTVAFEEATRIGLRPVEHRNKRSPEAVELGNLRVGFFQDTVPFSQ